MLKRLEAPAPIARRRALMITVAAMAIVYLLWNVSVLAPLAYPFRLFVTYVHEAGHSLAALLTGGRVIGFSVSADGSGLAATAGGTRALILPAGYIGAAVFGALLFYLINTFHRTRLIAMALGAGLIIFTLLYARPDASGLPLALLVGLATGAVLMVLGWKASRYLNLLVLNVLAMMTALNAVLDVVLLTRYSNVQIETAGGGIIRNDAAAFSAEIAPLIPAAVWAFLWAAIALALLGVSVYFSIVRPLWRSRGVAAATKREDDLTDLQRTEDGEIDFSQFR